MGGAHLQSRRHVQWNAISYLLTDAPATSSSSASNYSFCAAAAELQCGNICIRPSNLLNAHSPSITDLYDANNSPPISPRVQCRRTVRQRRSQFALLVKESTQPAAAVTRAMFSKRLKSDRHSERIFLRY